VIGNHIFRSQFRFGFSKNDTENALCEWIVGTACYVDFGSTFSYKCTEIMYFFIVSYGNHE